MSSRFENQVAVVTGGSTGIGLAIARALLAEGAKRVYVTGRSARSLDTAVTSLGERAVAVTSDVAQLPDLDRLKAAIERNGDQIDALFANAGIAGNNALGATSEADYLNIFDINVKGVFFTVQTLLPLLKDGASVVLTSSIVNNKGMENLSLYTATKAAVRSFARSWANDLKGRRIRVNALSPGFTHTPILTTGLKMDEQQISQFKEYAAGVVPAGYVAQPDEIASSALFLASNDARYVNGIDLPVDGGYAQI
ncbi:SDR family oxidoreductase [Paraburkholderia sp. D15]|uniref:SDR family NAD(P)-dependent oxidoreductase n=1 Tax=Paraburkholderia sp. D15 TaxID=2880218 RepID=UPI002478EA7B|nr:SDR family oxidoreductase [Paraburkholderia sp. D15]WGS48844.1 SDR family oxidoreductase [Paraburkholderia sp. D15]